MESRKQESFFLQELLSFSLSLKSLQVLIYIVL